MRVKKKRKPWELDPDDNWSKASKLRLRRCDAVWLDLLDKTGKIPRQAVCVLEPGVNFFVLMLEQIGAVTRYSCEGHPDGFMLMFEADYETARRISKCGFVSVTLFGGHENVYTLKFYDTSPPFESDVDRVQVLRLLAAAWETEFGKLQIPADVEKRGNYGPRLPRYISPHQAMQRHSRISRRKRAATS